MRATVLGAGQVCPCGGLPAQAGRLTKAFPYVECCGRFIERWDTPASDAEHLMRSRYSAFVLQRADYLLATWHASTRPASLDFEPGARWLGLEVLAHSPGPAPDKAVVRFVARYRVAGKAVRMTETSRFVRETVEDVARWFYVDGEQA